MGVYKELDIAYQEIVDELIKTNDFNNAENRIWQEIGEYDIDLADQLTDTIGYEAALVQIANNTIPYNNFYWQQLVVRTAYNMIADIDEFVYICEHSRFTQQEVQKMIDLAVGAVLSNPKFCIENFNTFESKRNINKILETKN